MTWQWAERDPAPEKATTYIVALATSRVRTLYWSGLEWCEQMNFAPYEVEVVAWAAMPDYPDMPNDVAKLRKRRGK